MYWLLRYIMLRTERGEPRWCAPLFLGGRDKPAMAHPSRYVSSSPSLCLLLCFIPSYFLSLILFFLTRVRRWWWWQQQGRRVATVAVVPGHPGCASTLGVFSYAFYWHYKKGSLPRRLPPRQCPPPPCPSLAAISSRLSFPSIPRDLVLRFMMRSKNQNPSFCYVAARTLAVVWKKARRICADDASA
jgi:hypothetical protein